MSLFLIFASQVIASCLESDCQNNLSHVDPVGTSQVYGADRFLMGVGAVGLIISLIILICFFISLLIKRQEIQIEPFITPKTDK